VTVRSEAPQMLDVNEIVRYLKVMTGKEFRMGKARDFPIPKERIKWFLYSLGARGVRATPYIDVVWAERDETVHIETERLGNTSDTTEWMYGDKALYELVDMDLTGFEKPAVREEYAKKFPIVVNRLESYRKLAAKTSKKSGVDMELMFHGDKGLASFWLEARFGAGEIDMPLVLHDIDRSVAALKQAYYEIAERQRDLYFIYALPANRKGTNEEEESR
jgi:hypothetical protein